MSKPFLSSLWERIHSPKPANSGTEDMSLQFPAYFPSPLIEIIVAYTASPPVRSYRSRQLERPGNEPIQGTISAFAFRKEDGSVVTWGDKQGGGDSSVVQAKLKNVKAICATYKAFAAIVGDDNKVVTWGNPDMGGDSSTVEAQLVDVVGICASRAGFAALKRDGSVVTWGYLEHFGPPLKEVTAISCTDLAFVAVQCDGTMTSWGNSPPKLKVECLAASGSGFIALLEDGTVETWGLFKNGAPRGRVTEAKAICTNHTSFAVLKRDGTVVGGLRDGKKIPSAVQKLLKGVIFIASNASAFAAVRNDGTVVTWGYGLEDQVVTELGQVLTELQQVESVCGSQSAFAALKSDGTVATWGDKAMGGDSSSVQSELWGVVAISATACAFAALRSDGNVVTWGHPENGGVFNKVNE